MNPVECYIGALCLGSWQWTMDVRFEFRGNFVFMLVLPERREPGTSVENSRGRQGCRVMPPNPAAAHVPHILDRVRRWARWVKLKAAPGKIPCLSRCPGSMAYFSTPRSKLLIACGHKTCLSASGRSFVGRFREPASISLCSSMVYPSRLESF